MTKTNSTNKGSQNSAPERPTLLGIDPARKAVFPDEPTRPSLRAWNEWRAKGYYPYVKIGKRVFIDPLQAQSALIKRFTIKEKRRAK